MSDFGGYRNRREINLKIIAIMKRTEDIRKSSPTDEVWSDWLDLHDICYEVARLRDVLKKHGFSDHIPHGHYDLLPKLPTSEDD